MNMPGRKFSGGSEYRYGFNGKELDTEDPIQYDYGFRIYDPRLARFKSLDPLQKKFPELTPYQFASNSPIANVDLDGKEALDYRYIFHSLELKLKNPSESDVWIAVQAAALTYKDQFFDLLEVTDVDDAFVIATTITRGKNAIGVKGEKVTSTDQKFAFGGAFVPFVSGALLRKVAKGLKGGEKVVDFVDKFQHVFNKMERMGVKALDQVMSSGYALRNNLKAAGKYGANQQAHHIIPVELVTGENQVVLDAINNGFDINSASNGLGISNTRHSGSHPNYRNQVETMVNQRKAELGENYTPSMAPGILNEVIDKVKPILEKSSEKINRVKITGG